MSDTPRPKSKTITFRMDQDMLELVEECAKQLGITRSQLIRRAIIHSLTVYQSLFKPETQKKIIFLGLKYGR